MSQNLKTLRGKGHRLIALRHHGKQCVAIFLIFATCFLTYCSAEIEPKIAGNYNNVGEFDGKLPTDVDQPSDAKILKDFAYADDTSAMKNDPIQTPESATVTGKSNLGFTHAFIASISVILVSELGDKTFFIAAIMAMRHARLIVFTGAIGALALMTVLSAVFGMAATVIPRVYTYYISAVLFAIFGLKMLHEGYHMSPTDAQDELEEVQSDLKKREEENKRKNRNKSDDIDCDKRKNSNSEPDQGHIGSRHTTTNNNGIIHRMRKPYNNNDSDAEEHQGPDEEDARRAMLPQSLPATSTAGNQQQPTSGVMKDTIVHNGTNGDVSHSVAETGVTKDSSIGQMAADNGGGNGMELKQLGSKNRLDRDGSLSNIDAESGSMRSLRQSNVGVFNSVARVFMQAFTMTFLAEWGDRSQLTTIILSTSENIYGVIVGGVLGHAFCTGLAVVGGRMIAQKISVRAVTIIGGIVFLCFAVSALFMGPGDD